MWPKFNLYLMYLVETWWQSDDGVTIHPNRSPLYAKCCGEANMGLQINCTTETDWNLAFPWNAHFLAPSGKIGSTWITLRQSVCPPVCITWQSVEHHLRIGTHRATAYTGGYEKYQACYQTKEIEAGPRMDFKLAGTFHMKWFCF